MYSGTDPGESLVFIKIMFLGCGIVHNGIMVLTSSQRLITNVLIFACAVVMMMVVVVVVVVMMVVVVVTAS